METRRLVIGMLLAMAVLFLWQPAFLWLGKQLGYDVMPPKPAETVSTQPTTQDYPQPATAAAPTTAAGPTTAGPTVAAAPLHALPATQPAVAEIGADAEKHPTYRMQATISPQGAGLDSVVLNEFRKTARERDPFVFQKPYPGVEGARSLATRTVTIDGSTINLAHETWTLEHSDASSATFAVTLADNAGPLARIRKTFALDTAADPSQGYELLVTHTFENLTNRPLKLAAKINGPALPPREQERGADRYVLAGFVKKNAIEIGYDMIESYSKEKPAKAYTADKDGNPVAWAGFASIYFNAIVHPLPLDPAEPRAGYIKEVTAVVLNPDSDPVDHEIFMTFDTADLSIEAGQSVSLPMRAFFGPRKRELLKSTYFAQFPISYNHTLVLAQGACAWCTFQWLIDILVWLLGVFHVLFRDWGLAIIALVVIVRAILHPVTKKSQISMSRMSKMGPEIERLKKKYGDNKDELNKAMVQVYKQQGVAPMLGCLPMFLQMPIWIALWQSLQTTFELRHAPFLWGFTWINDLAKPDALITWPAVPLFFGFKLGALNILPILMGFVFWLQTKFQPKPAAMTKEQEQQQKMMQWMTLLFPLFLYNGPSGLNLYILTSTAIGIVEAKIVRDHIKQREEAEKAGRVIVDAGKKFKTGSGKMAQPEKPKAGGLMGWWASLLQRAEQARREMDKKK